MNPEEIKDHKPEAPPAPEGEDKAKQHFDQLLRLKADFENTKKRLEKDKIEAIKFANEKLLEEILPIVDNMDRAMLSLAEGHDPKKVEQGLKIAQQELHEVLQENGVEVIKCVGTQFDPKIHEAVATVDDPGRKEGTITDELQKGYLLNGRLVRPSRVRVVQHTDSKEEHNGKR